MSCNKIINIVLLILLIVFIVLYFNKSKTIIVQGENDSLEKIKLYKDTIDAKMDSIKLLETAIDSLVFKVDEKEKDKKLLEKELKVINLEYEKIRNNIINISSDSSYMFITRYLLYF